MVASPQLNASENEISDPEKANGADFSDNEM